MNRNKSLFAQKAIDYFTGLSRAPVLPSPYNLINPYTNKEVKGNTEAFYNKFYHDAGKRVFIFGINPGRFGGGITGIPFTDPVALEQYCGIPNTFIKKRELSSTFIYKLIEFMGGVQSFFSGFYLTALFPYALTRDGNNFNFYDDPSVLSLLYPYISAAVSMQFNFGACISAVSLGKRNAVFLNKINTELNLFEKIITLEHPRYIMQYRRKHLDDYLSVYKKELSGISGL